VAVESVVLESHGSDAARSSQTVPLKTKVPRLPPIVELTGNQIGIEEGTDLVDSDSAPDKASSISSPTSSHYSHLSSSITFFVEEAKSSKKTVGASNYLRYLKQYLWTKGLKKGRKLSQKHGRDCLKKNPKFSKPLLELVFGYYKQKHKDSKEIQDDLGDVWVAKYGFFME
jgi:hypothetical protein